MPHYKGDANRLGNVRTPRSSLSRSHDLDCLKGLRVFVQTAAVT